MNKTAMSVTPNFYMLLLFTCFLSQIFSSSQTQLNASNIVSARSLDARLQDYAFKALSNPTTGTPYDAQVPSNLTGIKVVALRLRSISLTRRGVQSYQEFEIPKGVIERPYKKRIVLVYHNLGNWSKTFYPLYGYSYVAPILGLLAYDGTNLFASNLPELELSVHGKPILVKFPYVEKLITPFGSLPKCVYFDSYGTIKFDTLLNGNVCATFQQGHVSIVVESIAPALAPSDNSVHRKNKNKTKLKILIIGLVVGGILLFIMFIILIDGLRRVRKGKKIKKMELEADCNEVLKIAYIDDTKLPSAFGTRTQPMIEDDYVP